MSDNGSIHWGQEGAHAEPMGARYPFSCVTSRGVLKALQSALQPAKRLHWWLVSGGAVIPEDPRNRDARNAINAKRDWVLNPTPYFEDPPTLRDTGDIDPPSLR